MEIPELKRLDVEIEPWVCTQCGNCRTVCPVFKQLGWESASPRGKLYYIKKLLEKGEPIDPEFVNRLFQCSLCVRCEEVCQTKIDMMKVWQAVRSEIGKKGLWPKAVQGTVDTVTSKYNLLAMPQERRTVWSMMIEDEIAARINKVADVAYFVGCVSAFTSRLSGIPESAVSILNSAGVDYTILGADEWCCGNPLFFVGAHDKALELAKHNVEKLHQLKVKKLVASCAGCYRAFKQEYPKMLGGDLGFEVLHFSQYLAELIDKGQLKFKRPKEITVTYHDPCEIGRHCGVFDEPRHVLTSLPGVKLVEMPNNRHNSSCCGAGGMLKGTFEDISKAVAESRVNEAINTGAAALVSSCVACRQQFDEVVRAKNLKIRVYDIAEFVAQFL